MLKYFIIPMVCLLWLTSAAQAEQTVFSLFSEYPETDTAVNVVNLAGRVVARYPPDQVLDRYVFAAGQSLTDLAPFRGKLMIDADNNVLAYVPMEEQGYVPSSEPGEVYYRADNSVLVASGIAILLAAPLLIFAAVRYLAFKKQGVARRRCLHCGFVGEMKSLFLHKYPRRFLMVLFLLGVFPGLLCFCLGSGTYQCPVCRRTRTKSTPLPNSAGQSSSPNPSIR